MGGGVGSTRAAGVVWCFLSLGVAVAVAVAWPSLPLLLFSELFALAAGAKGRRGNL